VVQHSLMEGDALVSDLNKLLQKKLG